MRVLALDYGSGPLRVRAQRSTGTLATPIEPVVRPATRRGLRRLADLVRDREADRVVVGLPLRLPGARHRPDARGASVRRRSWRARQSRSSSTTSASPPRSPPVRAPTRAAEDSRAAAVLLEDWLARHAGEARLFYAAVRRLIARTAPGRARGRAPRARAPGGPSARAGRCPTRRSTTAPARPLRLTHGPAPFAVEERDDEARWPASPSRPPREPAGLEPIWSRSTPVPQLEPPAGPPAWSPTPPAGRPDPRSSGLAAAPRAEHPTRAGPAATPATAAPRSRSRSAAPPKRTRRPPSPPTRSPRPRRRGVRSASRARRPTPTAGTRRRSARSASGRGGGGGGDGGYQPQPGASGYLQPRTLGVAKPRRRWLRGSSSCSGSARLRSPPPRSLPPPPAPSMSSAVAPAGMTTRTRPPAVVMEGLVEEEQKRGDRDREAEREHGDDAPQPPAPRLCDRRACGTAGTRRRRAEAGSRRLPRPRRRG